MTDNEIIKALECCSVHPMNCKKCPYQGNECCTNAHRKDALDLINRQKAEIERLQNSGIRANSVEDWMAHCNELRAEAIKEFEERLKERAKAHYFDNCCYAVPIEEIDNLVKEMVGEG